MRCQEVGSANGIGYLTRRTPIKTRLLLQSLELSNNAAVTRYPQLSLVVKRWATVGQQWLSARKNEDDLVRVSG